MINKILLFLLCCWASTIFGISEYIDNSCQEPNNTIRETWNHKTYCYAPHTYMPPYNKWQGRDNGNCILKSPPPLWVLHYGVTCIETISESNFKKPKVGVRRQQCNALDCWSTFDLLQHGQCIMRTNGWGLPLDRLCARIALPKVDEDRPADPGYTEGKHLNLEGAEEDDDILEDANGNALLTSPVKLCLYNDPSIYNLLHSNLPDTGDIFPNEQFLHKTDKTYGVIKILQGAIKASASFQSGTVNVISMIFGSLGNIDDPTHIFSGASEVASNTFAFIAKIYTALGDAFIHIIGNIGIINRVVLDSYGCINMPLGPIPPPFCETIQQCHQTPVLDYICHKKNGKLVDSTTTKPCVVSTIPNNFIHNAIRVGFNNPRPLCKTHEDPLKTDRCVTIKNLPDSASTLNIATQGINILPPCQKDGNTTTPCINTKIQHICTDISGLCKKGFRVIFGTKAGEKPLYHQRAYVKDIKSCPNSTGGICQYIWGIDIGDFKDVAIKFPKLQNTPSVESLQNNFQLLDINNIKQPYNFRATIVRIPTIDKERGFKQTTDQICVYSDSGNMIGCHKRALNHKLSIYDCTTKKDNAQCFNNYFHPQVIVSQESGDDSTSGVLTTNSAYQTSKIYNKIILGSEEVTSFITDTQYAYQPFNDPHAKNTSTKYGKYRDDKFPKNIQDSLSSYIYGLEYINGEYYRGGDFICTQSPDEQRCPENTKNCVLAKLTNNDMISCKVLFQKFKDLHKTARMCPTNNNTCTQIIDSIQGKNTKVYIKKCDDESVCYDSGGIELCTTSINVQDRIYPEPELGDILLDTQYYSIYSGDTHEYKKFNQDIENIRNKTPFEKGHCIPISKPTCKEENNYSKENGFALWRETKVGESTEGICKAGFKQDVPFHRYCIPDPKKQIFIFEPLPKNIKCIKINNK